MRSHFIVFASCLLCTALTTGCGDTTFAIGEYGNLKFTLFTDYEMGSLSLTEVGIITEYSQNFAVSFTEQGLDETDRPEDLRHEISPSTGAILVQEEVVVSDDDEETYPGDAPDFSIAASVPGVYTITSYLDDEVFERIDLEFKAPESLELILWGRAPYVEEFSRMDVGGTLTVDEGTQIAFLIVPLDDNGDRLVGMMSTEWAADPATYAVPGGSVNGVYENELWGSKDADTLYFIEPGSVNVSFIDPLNEVTVDQDFLVEGYAE